MSTPRNLLLLGDAGAMLAMFYLAAYSNNSGSLHRVPPMDAGARAAVAMIYIYALFYGASWNGIRWLCTSEILPNRVRTVGMAICVCWQWLTQFVVVYSLTHMIIGIGYGTFLLFGVCSLIAIVFAWLFIPETKGVELEDMGLPFGDGVPWKAGSARKHYFERRRTVADRAEEKMADVDEKPLASAEHMEV